MYKLFLCVRYLLKRRIAFFAVAAVCLCVAMVLIVVSVMGGFLQLVEDRSRGLLGDLVVENNALQGFPYYEEFIEGLKSDPVLGEQIHEATPVIITYGILRFPQDQITNPVQIVGIHLEETYRVNDFRKGLFYEQYYPGTTTFAPRPRPHYGLSEDDEPILPPELEAAWTTWWADASRREREQTPFDEDLQLRRPGYYLPLPLEYRVTEGYEPTWLGEAWDGAILGTDLCARRNQRGEYDRFYARGEPVQLTFVPISPAGTIVDGTGMPSKVFRYVDDSRSGVYDIDSKSVYIDFDVLQQIIEMDAMEMEIEDAEGNVTIEAVPARATQIQIKLEPWADPHQARDAIRAKWAEMSAPWIRASREPELLRRVEIKTWREKQARFIEAVEKEKYLVTTLFGVISIVAVLLVGCIFYMIVQEKTRDIGIIKSVGATPVGVANIFLAYGAAVGVVGGAIGCALGVLFVWNINGVQTILAHFGVVVWDPAIYTFDRIPNTVKTSDTVVIYIVAVVASMAGALIAAMRAARVWPVEALRYE